MPLFAMALIVARRRRNASVAAAPVAAPPLWWLLAGELAHAIRVTWVRIAGRR